MPVKSKAHLRETIIPSNEMVDKDSMAYDGTVLPDALSDPFTKKLYLESYGCQMNFSDSEVVASILKKEGYQTTSQLKEADLILVNTCSIREKAEQTVRNRLTHFQHLKEKNKEVKVGVLGCMAERLKHQFLEEEKIVDIVVGPDAYKDLPNLLREADANREAVNVILSKEETYGDIAPVRLSSNGVSAFVTITRGCDNMCTFCVVPFTRGRERSRDPKSILNEINDLAQKGYKEITLLGQNVDSYLWYGGGLKKDFKNATPLQKKTALDFSKLLQLVAEAHPSLRIRFSTSNPQDMSLQVLHTMAAYDNICKYIHLPVQSGSKKRRLQEIIALQQEHSQYRTQQYIGKTECVLIEKTSKKSEDFWSGRTTQNTVVVFPKEHYQVGDFVEVYIESATTATLIGIPQGYSDRI
jgi:tRNA-2-methylthio-N6-dimethylallyladenosine synthase